MRLGLLAISLLFGTVVYAHITDNMGLEHSIGICAGLITGVLVLAFLSFWLMENDPQMRKAERWHRKNRS